MLKHLLVYIKLFHAILIIRLCLILLNQKSNCNLEEIIVELILTLFLSIIQFQFNLLSLLCTFSLAYSLNNNPYNWIACLYLLKIGKIAILLDHFITAIVDHEDCHQCRLVRIILHIIRYTIIQYMFLGCILICYKYYCIYDNIPLPSDLQIFYQLIVTASTIGYGDYTPKSQLQIYFFIGAIPIVCAGFIIYLNCVIPLLQQLLVFFRNKKITPKIISNINVNKMGKAFKQTTTTSNLHEFIIKLSEHELMQKQINQYFHNNWLGLSMYNCTRFNALLDQVIPAKESKQTRLRVCSLIIIEYYPQDWIIVKAGNHSNSIYMILQGQVIINEQVADSQDNRRVYKKNNILNRKGFYNKKNTKSEHTYICKTFVSVARLTLSDLNQFARFFPLLQNFLISKIISDE